MKARFFASAAGLGIGLWLFLPACLSRAGDEAPPAPALAQEDSPSGLRIRNISLKGCDKISARSLRSVMRLEKTAWWRRRIKEGGYDPFWAEEDRRRMELYYRSRGFYDARVTGPEVRRHEGERSVSLVYAVEEGEPVYVRGIAIRFAEEAADADGSESAALRRLVRFHPGSRFETEAYRGAAEAMEKYYKDRGYYRAHVKRSAEVDAEAFQADVAYEVTKGETYRLGNISLEGFQKTRASVLRRAINLKEGQLYNREEVFVNQRRIHHLPIYAIVRIQDEPDDEARRVDLRVRVDEGKAREIKTGIGYGSEEDIRLQASWRHYNMFHGAEVFSFGARWSDLLEVESVRLDLSNAGRPDALLQLGAERRVQREESFSHEAISLVPSYRFPLSRHLTTALSYRIERNHITEFVASSGVKPEDLAREGILSAAAWSLEWLEVDDLLEPRHGLRAGFFAEYGGGPLLGDFDYWKTTAEARFYRSPLERLTIALRARIGWAEPQGDLQALPLFKRFFTGGTSSVRGFDRFRLGPLGTDGKPLGGSRLWEHGAELRISLTKKFGLVLFTDGGWVWLESEAVRASDVVPSAGAGLRFRSPLGPVSLDVGFPLSSDPLYPNYRLHLNIGHSF